MSDDNQQSEYFFPENIEEFIQNNLEQSDIGLQIDENELADLFYDELQQPDLEQIVQTNIVNLNIPVQNQITLEQVHDLQNRRPIPKHRKIGQRNTHQLMEHDIGAQLFSQINTQPGNVESFFNIFETIFYKDYTVEQIQQKFNGIPYESQLFWWKRYIKKMFSGQPVNQSYQLAGEFTNYTILPQMQALNAQSTIKELILPGFAYMNYEIPGLNQQRINTIQTQLQNNNQQLINNLPPQIRGPFNAFMIMTHNFHNNDQRIKFLMFKQMTKNFDFFIQFMKIVISFVGRNVEYDRIWISFEVQGYELNNNYDFRRQFSQIISLSYGVLPQQVLQNPQANINENFSRDQFIETLIQKMSFEGFQYSFMPFYLQHAQIYMATNTNHQPGQPTASDFSDNIWMTAQMNVNNFQEMLEAIQDLDVFRKKKPKQKQSSKNKILKKIQYIDNKYGIFHQKYNEPCLYTLYRFIYNVDYPWSKIKKKLNRAIYLMIKKGKLSELLEYFYEKKGYFYNFGIFFYNSNRWINQQAYLQFIIIDSHIIISNNEKVEQLVYTDIRKYKQLFVLQPLDKKKPSKKEIKQFYYDIESYTENSGKNIPYLIVFYDKEKNNSKNFWGENCIKKSIKWLIRISEEYEKIKIWSFNGSGYDNQFLWKQLLDFNLPVQIYGTHNNIKMMQFDNISFYDIKLIFTRGSLSKQAEQWKLEYNKFVFDIGNKSRIYFEKMKKPIILYCIQDCKVLAQLVQKFYQLCNEISFQGKKLVYDNIFTASQLSLQIYQQLYQQIPIAASGNVELFHIEKSSYYGGMTQVFQKIANDFYYYDINSSYPYVLKQYQFPYEFISRSKYYPSQQIQDFYLYEVDIIFNDDVQIPFIPQRGKDGLYYCLNVEKSWRWGVDINLGIKYNLFKEYNIHQVIKYKVANLFSDFINDLYEKRKQAKEQNRSDLSEFYKLVMNSLYGKFGQNLNTQKKYCKQQNLIEYINNHNIIQMINEDRKYINNQPNLYIKEVDSLRKLNNDIFQIEYVKQETISEISSLVRIASLTTRYAVRQLYEGIMNVGQDNIIYCDTDSIMTKIPMTNELLDNQELGKWKLEKNGQIIKGYFAAPKLYYLQTKEDEYELKSKGIQARFDYIFDDQRIQMNAFSKQDMKKIEKMICDLIFSKQQQILIENQKQFIKKKLDIYVIPIKKIIKVQNKKRIFDGIYSKPLCYIPENVKL